MQVFSGGNPLGEKEFFSTAREAFERGQQALAENPEADEVRIGVERERPQREGPKKRGVGVTRSSGSMSKAKRKAQKKARKAQR